MKVVTETGELQAVCRQLNASSYITVDTEFHREKTYWPDLCLIQAAGEGVETMIDPLAEGLDLTPFFDLLTKPGLIKVFHAARQDIEIFYKLTGAIPAPLFDTQIAAMVCGFGDQAGYETLVRKILGREVDKSSRVTDWARRPLSERQLRYALADVTHLRDIYKELQVKLEETSRSHWLEEEISILTSPTTYQIAPENAWRRLKLRRPGKKTLGVLIELAAWRERTAQARNKPRGRILKDDALQELALSQPHSRDELAGLRFLHNGFANKPEGQEILNAIKAGLARAGRNELPALAERRADSSKFEPLIDLLKVLLKARAEAHGVAARLIASRDALEQIACQEAPDVPALHGWRREIFGEDALALKHGRLLLAAENGRVVARAATD